MRVLIVVAHPDDEVLGCGATAAVLSEKKISVLACIMCGEVDVRRHRPKIKELDRDIKRAQEILGLGEPILGGFPNIKMNTVSHFELVQFIEKAIETTQADTILTHHPWDLNNDHLQTSLACQAASRLFQRRAGTPPLRAVYFMEIPSSTEWAFGGSSRAFEADTFFEVGSALDKKIEALRAYRGVMRDYPHPRSEEALRALAAFRGAQCGRKYAEAFKAGFQMIDGFLQED